MSLSEHEQQVLDEIERDLASLAADGHLLSRWQRPGARLARSERGGALVLGVLLVGVGLVHPSAAGEAIAVAGYLVLVGAVATVLDARRRRGMPPAWSRLRRLLARTSTTRQRGDDSGPGGPA